MPLPCDLTESALAEWLCVLGSSTDGYVGSTRTQARAVRALVEDRVRAALEYAVPAWEASSKDAAVRSVMGGA